MKGKNNNQEFVDWFRSSSPYINMHRGRTFVILFGGEAIEDDDFEHLVHDIATLNSLGIRLVIVHGIRPQIEKRLRKLGKKSRYEQGLRVTDSSSLDCLKEAVGHVRVEIEALLSMGLANTPMSGARIQVASGNFVTARPLGVRDGTDYGWTGEVRRIDTAAIHQRLHENNIVLLSPLGYSPTGEVFNLSAEDVAGFAAQQLHADKLIMLMNERGVLDSRRKLIQQLTPGQASTILEKRKLPGETRLHLATAARACRSGVKRSHLIDRRIDGALLQELFTRDGIGTLVTAETYETLRPARIEDVGGILELIRPFEDDGTLVRRSRERLETEISHFTVIERDGMVIGCAALYPFTREKFGELACLAVHDDYRGGKRGEVLLEHIEQEARKLGVEHLFVLTTMTSHWFRERGFESSNKSALPMKKRDLYNYRRNSRVLLKNIGY
jgi:amino-acid N-acetyltransferase